MFKIIFGGHLPGSCILFECLLEFVIDPRCFFLIRGNSSNFYNGTFFLVQELAKTVHFLP